MAIPQERASSDADVGYDLKLAGRRVRHAREDLGWDREKMAALLTTRTPERWTADKVKFVELARRRIDPPLLRVLSETLGRPANYFLYSDFEPTGNLPELSRVSSDAGAKILPFRKPGQRSGRLIAPAPNLADPAIA